jgi:hypothetical protein
VAAGPDPQQHHIEKTALKADFQEQSIYRVILKIPH